MAQKVQEIVFIDSLVGESVAHGFFSQVSASLANLTSRNLGFKSGKSQGV